MSTGTAIRVFISYSHRDEALRDQLVSHLFALKRQNLIEEWYDRKIAPGEDFPTAIDTRLESAEVVLLLVSSDFVSSVYCWEKELELSLERHEAGKTVVVPIVVRPVELQDLPFERIESLPTDRKPVTTWENRDEAWVDVIRGLRKVLRAAQERRVRAREARTPEQVGNVLKLRSSTTLEGQQLKTGYAKLDAVTSGLSPAELIVVGSRPSLGKTTLALNIAMNVAFSGHPKVSVGLFSLETAREQISLRVLSAAARVSDLRSGRFSDEEWSHINGAISLMKHSSLYLEDSPILSTGDLRIRARKLKDQHGLGLLIVDHIQLLQVPGGANVHDQRAQVTKELREIARELAVPLIVTAQLSRKIDRRTDKRPALQDLPEGYDLDVHADLVLLLYREEYYDPYTERRGIADLTIAKHRNGPTGEIQLVFLPSLTRFENLMAENELPLE